MSIGTITNWREYERKLKGLLSCVRERIEIIEHAKDKNNFSLLNELKILLCCIEDGLDLEGGYKKEITSRINIIINNEPKEQVIDPEIILEDLNFYEKRIKNDIFGDIFSQKEDSGWYRVDPISYKEIFYFGFAKNALSILDEIRDQYCDFHLDDPEKDVLNLNHCNFFKVYEKNPYPRSFRCKLNKGPCALAYSVERADCPNLEDLILFKTDFFEDFIRGNYKTIDKDKV